VPRARLCEEVFGPGCGQSSVIPFRFVDGIIGICQRYITHR
jgi:hypothetical protein